MSEDLREKLYRLMPAVYRERDAASGEALRALLAIVEAQADLVEDDIRRLWDNFFVELCDPWVVPYIGDLVGTTPLFDESRVAQPDSARSLFPDLSGPRFVPDVGLRSRADVAKTIYYRRRKGTLPMLEELARDVTGWGAHAVEFFERLGWTQCVRNHLRLHSTHGAELRSVERCDRTDGPFDAFSQTADVRAIAPLEGWHNIRNIGFFLWRLTSYEAEGIDARRVGAAGDHRYRVSPLGNDAPLFTRWRREGDEAGLATELHVPGPIRPSAFFEDLRAHQGRAPAAHYSEFYGLFDLVPGSSLVQAPAASLMVVLHRSGSAPEPIPPDRVRCMNLASWTRPTGHSIGIDVERGRLALGASVSAERVEVFYHYGFSANLGGGSYRRQAWLTDRRLPGVVVLNVTKSGAAGSFATIASALAEWSARGKPNCIVAIGDSRSYAEAIGIEPADGRWLAIEAADEARPHLRLTGALIVTGEHPEASLSLNGLLIEGRIDVQGSLGHLRVIHSTLVPGTSIAQTDPPSPPPSPVPASVTVAGGTAAAPRNQQFRLEIAFSVVGPLRLPYHAEGILALDSIIDGVNADAIAGLAAASPGPPLWLERVTLFGRTRAKELTLASEAIFDAPVSAERRQTGCVRFSYIAPGSTTPRRYRCQPDLFIAAETEAAEAAAEAAGQSFGDPQREAIARRVEQWLAPEYSSQRYGDPRYAQLHLACPQEIAAGAEDGSEMGAYCHLKQPQRAANLKRRLQEYLPFGLEPGLIYVT